MGYVGVHTAPKYGTKPIRYVMLLFVNKSPVCMISMVAQKAIHCSVNIEGLIVPGH